MRLLNLLAATFFGICLVACSTVPQQEVYLVPSLYGGYYLERDIVHNNQFNVHSLEFQTYTSHEIIYIDHIEKEISGEHIRIGQNGPNSPHPKGTIKLNDRTIEIQLLKPYLTQDGYQYKAYEHNGTYPLVRNSRSPI